MINTKFINNKVALYTLIIGCFVVSVSMGIRQTYGIFFQFFETDLNITSTYFGLAIGVQAIVWGIFATIFGMIADKYGSNKVVMIALVTYAIGIYSLGNLNSQGFLFQINLGILVGIGLGGAAAPIIVPTVAKHFPNHNRAKAAGLVTAFASVGMFIYPIMSSTLFNYYSWGKILNKPIKDKIAAPVHPSKPLSITYCGTCVATNVIWKPQTKKPAIKNK